MVREKWLTRNKADLYYKPPFFLVREKWLTRKKVRVCRTTFLEPLFYTFLEKWLQIKCSTVRKNYVQVSSSCENEISLAQKMFKLIWARRAVVLCTFVVNPQPVAFADVVD